MPTTPTRAVIRLPRFNPTNDGRLAYAVYRSQRLSDLLPADKVGPLVAAYDRAVELADAAAKATLAAHDAADDVREAVRTGEPVDVDAVIDRMARARIEEAAHREAVQFFKTLPADAHRDIVSLIESSEDNLYTGLAEQLTDVLDRAEPVIAALGGVRDADAAIEGKLTKEWSALKEISRDYHDIVTAFRALLSADDTVTTRTDPAYVLFGGLTEVAPTFAAEAQGKPTDLRGRPVTDLPFDPKATDSLDHLRYVVVNRGRLQPRIVRADEAASPATPLMPGGAIPARLEGGRLIPGSQEFESAMTRARNAAANRDADERADIAASGGVPD